MPLYESDRKPHTPDPWSAPKPQAAAPSIAAMGDVKPHVSAVGGAKSQAAPATASEGGGAWQGAAKGAAIGAASSVRSARIMRNISGNASVTLKLGSQARRQVMPSATTADRSDSIDPSSANDTALGNTASTFSSDIRGRSLQRPLRVINLFSLRFLMNQFI